jgi:molybdopterin-guanine dinucleotide biosynthesis protein A
MGREKALLQLPDGRTTLQVVVAAARAVADPVLLSVRSRPEGERLLTTLLLPAPDLLVDHTPGAGPLCALAGALEAASAPLLLALAVDMPLVRPALLRLLAAALAPGKYAQHGETETRRSDYDLALPMIGGVPQPLPACYAASLAPLATRLVREGAHSLRALHTHAEARPCLLDEATLRRADPDLRSFIGANTPEEWVRLLAYHSGQGQ